VSDLDPPRGDEALAGEAAAPPPGAGAPRPARKRAPKKAARPAKKPAAGDPSRTAKTPPPVDDARATRNGFIVIAITVVVGLVIFGKGIQKDNAPTVVASGPTTLPGISVPQDDRNAPPTVTTPGQGTTVTVTPATSVAPADLKIIVANGIDPSKTIAGPVATKLEGAGYATPTKIDLTSTSAKSYVYYTGDLQPEAQAIATALGYDSSTVTPMPSSPPTSLNGAQILVVVGLDKA